MLTPSRQSHGLAPARQQGVDEAGESRGSVLPGAGAAPESIALIPVVPVPGSSGQAR